MLFGPLDLGFLRASLKIFGQKIRKSSVPRILGLVLFCPKDPREKESGLTNNVKANR